MNRICSLLAVLILILFLSASLSAQTPIPSGASYDLGFSPGGSSLAVVLKAISSARSTLDVACYEFTSRDIAAAIEAAAHHGVKVLIVADYKSSKEKYSQILVLKAASHPPR